MDQDRVNAVADALATVGYDGIAAFDETEPEYGALELFYEEFGNEPYVKLLGICAATQDYQLNGDAQEFWRELERTATKYDSLDSTQTVRDVLGDFMEAGVNARLNQQKRDRLIKLFEAGFDEWFVENHAEAEPVEVWERLADSMDNRMKAKTIVLAMKIYDIAHLIRHGEYLEFPFDIPIPCDLQVERVSHTSGITDSEETDQVMSAWAEVMESVGDRLDKHVSLLRIDSIVWQAGQIIGRHEPDREAAYTALMEHFDMVGLEQRPAQTLAEELIFEM
jgi:N-glycosylase/DNA lyase